MCNCNGKHSSESKVKRRSAEWKDRETKREGGEGVEDGIVSPL